MAVCVAVSKIKRDGERKNPKIIKSIFHRSLPPFFLERASDEGGGNIIVHIIPCALW